MNRSKTESHRSRIIKLGHIKKKQLSRILKTLINLALLCEPGLNRIQVQANVNLFNAFGFVTSSLEGVEELPVMEAVKALRLSKPALQAEFLYRQQRASGGS